MNTSPQRVVPGGPSPHPCAASLRDTLRGRTADAHAALEATPLMQAFAAGTADRHYARAYLSRQYRLHRDLEHALAPVLPADVAATRLGRTGWIASDLLDLGLPLDDRPARVPALDGRAAGLGALYVIEGSTLGLQSIRRRLATAGHPGWVLESRFVRGYGDATAARWREFLLLLESLPGQHWTECCEAAVLTFEAFHQLFQDTTHD